LHDQAIHLPRGSTITLTAEPVPAAGSPAAPPEIRVLMRDDGPGLPPELLRVVFDPFVVRSDLPGEFGINLMACFFIAHYHGGRIEAQSDPGKGSTFCLTFRTDPNQPPAATEPTNIVEQAIGTGSLFARLQRQSG
jgi:signal transduction histidine kinase